MKENYLHLCDSILFNTFRVEMGKNVLILEENFNSIQFNTKIDLEILLY